MLVRMAAMIATAVALAVVAAYLVFAPEASDRKSNGEGSNHVDETGANSGIVRSSPIPVSAREQLQQIMFNSEMTTAQQLGLSRAVLMTSGVDLDSSWASQLKEDVEYASSHLRGGDHLRSLNCYRVGCLVELDLEHAGASAEIWKTVRWRGESIQFAPFALNGSREIHEFLIFLQPGLR